MASTKEVPQAGRAAAAEIAEAGRAPTKKAGLTKTDAGFNIASREFR